LQSPTGTGKTYLVLVRLANDPAFFAQLNIERIVYLCPTNALGQQQADKHKIPFLTSLRKEDASEVTQSRVIAATFDQVSKMPQSWQDNSLFIVDEFHTLTSDFSYRRETMRCLLKFLQSSKHVLGITVTPNSAFIKYLNYALCVAEFVNAEQAQKIKVHPILLEKGGAKDVLTDVERRRDAHRVTVLKFDDFELLRSYEKILVEKYGAAAVTLISSKEDATSVHNVHYQSLMKTDRVGEEIQFVLCTKFLEAGVSSFLRKFFTFFRKRRIVYCKPSLDRALTARIV
jgi:superfamily II DNA or RNA helicase